MTKEQLERVQDLIQKRREAQEQLDKLSLHQKPYEVKVSDGHVGGTNVRIPSTLVGAIYALLASHYREEINRIDREIANL